VKIRVITPIPLTEDQRSRLVRLGADYFATDRFDPKDELELSKRILDAEIIVITAMVRVSGEVLRKHPQLKLIQSLSTGFDHIDLKVAQSMGIVAKNAGDYCTEAVAERTLTFMLLLATQVVPANRLAASGIWEPFRAQGRELRGRKLLLIGYGKIGKRVGELAKVFGMVVSWANSRTSREEILGHLAHADVVSLHCPYTPETHHLLDEKAFRAVKHGAIIINTARGKLVDEAALLDALNQGQISSAALDVLSAQPPPKDHPLVKHERVFVTPFCAWNTEEAVDRRAEIMISSIEEFIAGSQKKPELQA
jgi:phosphoglycerate dehydrogenase-like enzyme